MADAYRVKVKVGQFEFEAEGEKDVVDRQYNQFLDHLPKSGTPTGRRWRRMRRRMAILIVFSRSAGCRGL